MKKERSRSVVSYGQKVVRLFISTINVKVRAYPKIMKRIDKARINIMHYGFYIA
jgi:hypothetical protein